MEAFLTGSRIYGTPRPDSDLDLCICCDSDEVRVLFRSLADTAQQLDEERAYAGRNSLRFGRLNLLMLDSREFSAWAVGNELLIAAAPVTRDVAIDALMRVQAGDIEIARRDLANARTITQPASEPTTTHWV